MLKTAKINNVMVFAISFLVSFTIVWLVLSHLRHTITNALFSTESSDIAFAEEPQPTTTQIQQESTGCGCPSCCAVSEVL
jgi:hypothetical protein